MLLSHNKSSSDSNKDLTLIICICRRQRHRLLTLLCWIDKNGPKMSKPRKVKIARKNWEKEEKGERERKREDSEKCKMQKMWLKRLKISDWTSKSFAVAIRFQVSEYFSSDMTQACCALQRWCPPLSIYLSSYLQLCAHISVWNGASSWSENTQKFCPKVLMQFLASKEMKNFDFWSLICCIVGWYLQNLSPVTNVIKYLRAQITTLELYLLVICFNLLL